MLTINPTLSATTTTFQSKKMTKTDNNTQKNIWKNL